MRAQQEIGFSESFALAEDRREALRELIPGTSEFFYFHCLHYQNQGQFAQAQAVLDSWRAKLGDTPQARAMTARQSLLTYSENPQRTREFLIRELGVQLQHPVPSRNRAADLPSQLDNQQISTATLVASSLSADRSLSQFENKGLWLLLNRPLSVEQLRALLGRLDRADLPQLVQRIAEELALKDSRGFGWAGVHQLLTLEQLEQLLRLRPELLQHDAYVRAVTARLVPSEASSLTDPGVLREYLQRLLTWAERLPESQNSFKALVLGNLLRLEMSQGQYDRARFLAYLALPRAADYYNLKRFGNRPPELVELNFSMQPQVPLQPIGDDSQLIRRYLEQFLKSQNRLDDFAQFLDRDYLEKVLAETQILYGNADSAAGEWYAKLSPAEQKTLRERVEVRFAPHNKTTFAADAEVGLEVEIKNVPQLIVKIYEINTLNYYRNHSNPLGTDIDLDGLVANSQRTIEFSQPADRRHASRIELPELAGRGVWVVDLLGAGTRCRALIQKGSLIGLERLGDAGHVFRIVDEAGRPRPAAHIELGGRSYLPDDDGQIVLPYAEQTVTRNILLVDEELATQVTLAHRSEAYQLQAGFLIDRQALVAGRQASVAIRTRLTCNDRPISIRLLEQAQLSVTATDADGIATSQTIALTDLDDGDEWVHTFLVPQRLVQLDFSLSGRVANRSRNELQSVSSQESIRCNGIQASDRIADFFLVPEPTGFRLRVLGRNGEPIPHLPVSVSIKLREFKSPQHFSLASDELGSVELGSLDSVTSLTATAGGMTAAEFEPSLFHRHWPRTIQVGQGAGITLPLGKETADAAVFTLNETRRDVRIATLADKIKLETGGLFIAPLTAGDYLLEDHETRQSTRITVGDAEAQNEFSVGRYRILQTEQRRPLVVRSAQWTDGALHIQVDGADAMTRVHVVATSFLPGATLSSQVQLPYPGQWQSRVQPPRNHFIDSLRLDEEYSYILDRQRARTFLGNMLPQPSLLIHPWELSVTENLSKQAAAGDALPASPAPESAMRRSRAEGEASEDKAPPDWKSFDFLASPASLVANLGLVDGQVSVPAELLRGASHLTVIAVHPSGIDSRQVVLDPTPTLIRDQRLQDAFDAQQHLVQVQRVELLNAGESRNFGDPRTRRLQTFGTIAGVFQLYSTLLENDSEWEKFRFVTQWQTLPPEEQLARYSEMACHELNFFLYHKDRPFFDRVIRPFLQQKLDKQLVDLWLLDRPLDEFVALWRLGRLNTLERVLLASRIESMQTGTQRWLSDYLAANAIDPQWRRNRFEVALRGSSLASRDDLLANLEPLRERFMDESEVSDFRALGSSRGGRPPSARSLRLGRGVQAADMDVDGLMDLGEGFFSIDRASLAADYGFFRSLQQTRQWAETQYYHVRLAQQSHELIPANPFWQEYLAHATEPFLPRHLEFPCSNIHEALCALAVIDLPLSAAGPTIKIEDNDIIVESPSPGIVFLESVEPQAGGSRGNTSGSILTGQEIYLADPGSSSSDLQPVGDAPLVQGTSYVGRVVVTNPTNTKRRIDVLTQLPAGSIPLKGSRVTRSTPLEIAPYSTSQVEYTFYFPTSGQFEHYGAQISDDGGHLTATESRQVRVLEAPESIDETSWSYLADWGTNDRVLEALETANLQQVDLSRIAFRMRNSQFYRQAIDLLAAAGRFDATLWGYALQHNDARGIEQLLQHRRDFLEPLGPVLQTPLVTLDPRQQMSYEHLDYKPLVLARQHQLGPKRVILNPSLRAQYEALLNVLAHASTVSDDQKLQLCYYMLLQNRIEEALDWFAQVEQSQIQTSLQYAYFDAYLDIYRGEFDRARSIAAKFVDYPVLRWRELFAQVVAQVDARDALLEGRSTSQSVVSQTPDAAEQQILTGRREAAQTLSAVELPVLELDTHDAEIAIRYRGLKQVQVNYYLMDIELLFSRKPFVAQGEQRVPAIEPNVSYSVELDGASGTQAIRIPAEIRNRNFVVEVTSSGLTRSTVITSGALTANLVEPYGQIQVSSLRDRRPVAAAYVKVYARHAGGEVRFFKDGYTDLRGYFDYASLSTSDLDTTERFAILILDAELGAVVQEAAPPTR